MVLKRGSKIEDYKFCTKQEKNGFYVSASWTSCDSMSYSAYPFYWYSAGY